MKREKLFEYFLQGITVIVTLYEIQEQGNAVEESDNVNTGENLR